MQQILTYFWQMCLLKEGPERLPTSWFVLSLTLVVYLTLALLSLVVTRSGDMTVPQMLGSAVSGILIEGVVVIALLAFKGVIPRFQATMAALLGANAVILILMLPLQMLLTQLDQSPVRVLLEVAFFASFLWWLAIAGFILHRAANVSILQGAAITFGVEILALTTTLSLFTSQA